MAQTNDDPNLVPELTPQTPWWNRSVLGEGGLIEELTHLIGKDELPEEAVLERKKALTDMLVFAKTAEAIDSKQFVTPEFISFIKIRHMLTNNIGEYGGLEQSARYLQLAIGAKDLLIFIDQTELRYRGFKQQEFYEHVAEILKTNEGANAFIEKLESAGQAAIAQTKTEEGQQALRDYVGNLEKIARNPLGLKLLNRFRAFQLSDYSVLSSISDLIRRIEVKHIYDINRLTLLVTDNYNLFEKISKIIQIPPDKSNPRSMAIIIQYIALTHQYEIIGIKFEEMIRVLRKWLTYYQKLQAIAQEYPLNKYKYPQDAAAPIPGEALYRKYLELLTDKKQGFTYYDLG